MAKRIHSALDVAGVLRWPDSRLSGMCRNDDGHVLTGREVRAALTLLLDRGHRVLPIGEPCEGFSYQTGCPGHETAPPAPQEGSDA